MEPEGFDTKEEIIDEWKTKMGDEFRLMYPGSGPTILQRLESNSYWAKEKTHYEWGVIIHRIEMLKEALGNADSVVKDYSKNTKDKIYILPDTSIADFSRKTANETNVEKIESLLMEFIQEHFQFRI